MQEQCKHLALEVKSAGPKGDNHEVLLLPKEDLLPSDSSPVNAAKSGQAVVRRLNCFSQICDGIEEEDEMPTKDEQEESLHDDAENFEQRCSSSLMALTESNVAKLKKTSINVADQHNCSYDSKASTTESEE